MWKRDRELLDRAAAFYTALAKRMPAGRSWAKLDPAERTRRMRANTDAYLATVL